MILALLLGCTPAPPPDAAPFSGVLRALDADGDGRVTLEEYPQKPPGGSPAAEVDRDGDGEIGPTEVRDEVFAVDPAAFDKMAWKRSGRATPSGDGTLPSERSVTGYKPPPGPLAEALRFLADLAAARAPDRAPLDAATLDAAAAAGMATPEGAVVLAHLDAAGVDVPADRRDRWQWLAGCETSSWQRHFR